jgi:hypothetical protein
MLQASLNPMMYRLPSRRYDDDQALCFVILPFGDVDFVKVKDEFNLMDLHVLSDEPNCRVKETTRNFEALCFVRGTCHFV